MEFKKEQDIVEAINTRENADKIELLKEFTKSMMIVIVFLSLDIVAMTKYQEAALFIIKGFKGIDWHATIVVLSANLLVSISIISAIISYEKLKRNL